MLLESLREYIGTVPVGYEVIEYVFCGLFGLTVVQSCISFISGLFRIFGRGGRHD